MSNEWYTPSKYIEAARSVMGSIDLDPASCSLANETVKATTYYTKEQNGLALPWHGNVWLNPPFGKLEKQNGTTLFTKKLIQSYAQKEVKQALVLTLMGMYARWYFDLLAFPVCFIEEKPLFISPDGQKITHAFAQSCFYVGKDFQTFKAVFSEFGRVKM